MGQTIARLRDPSGGASPRQADRLGTGLISPVDRSVASRELCRGLCAKPAPRRGIAEHFSGLRLIGTLRVGPFGGRFRCKTPRNLTSCLPSASRAQSTTSSSAHPYQHPAKALISSL